MATSRAGRRLLLNAMAIACGMVLWPRGAQTQPWPVRLVLPFVADSLSDVLARAVAAAVSDALGKTVFIDPLPGRDGRVAMAEVARASDQHTLVLGHCGSLAIDPLLLDSLPYDPVRDFRPISLLAKAPNLYVVPVGSPARSLQQLVSLAQAGAGGLTYGSLGGGSADRLAMEYLAMACGMRLTHQPCADADALLTELLAGRLDIAAMVAATAAPHIATGRLRCIASGAPRRMARLPDTPTVAEQGWPGYETTQWYGLLAPAALSDETAHRLSTAAARALHAADVQAWFQQTAAMAVGSTAIELARFIADEQRRWKPVVARVRHAAVTKPVDGHRR